MQQDHDYFERCLDKFPDIPSLIIVRSVEVKNIPKELFKPPILDLRCGDGFFASMLGLKNTYECDISGNAI